MLQFNSGFFLLKKGKEKYFIRIELDAHEPSATLFFNYIYSDLKKKQKFTMLN